MFSAIRKRIRVSPATVIALVALVFALTGGAFAASSHNNGSGKATAQAGSNTALATAAKSKKKTAPKPVRGPAGPKGATGATGPAGAAGATGPGGPVGVKGETGPAGATGATGVTGVTGATGATGKTGVAGAAGSPWTAGGTLPVGSTETGVWVAPMIANVDEIGGNGSISFNVPLALGTAPAVEYINPGEEGKEHATECPGTLEDPKAAEGFLCVYALSNAFATFEEATSYTAGAYLSFKEGHEAGFTANGTWAVTAGS
jgi:hypothetical protein